MLFVQVPYPYLPPAGKFNEGPKTWSNTFRFDSKTLDNPKPIGVVTRENTFEEYMGRPIKQTNGERPSLLPPPYQNIYHY